MTEDDTQALPSLLKRLLVQMAELVDFIRGDPATIAAKVRLLSAAAVVSSLLAGHGPERGRPQLNRSQFAPAD
jgi:hypothetical protein